MTNLHSDKIKTANLHTTTNHIYTNTKLRKLLVPIIIEQLLASLMGTVDTMMVSNVGSAAISAVSLVDSINILVIQALSALAAGGAILMAYKEAAYLQFPDKPAPRSDTHNIPLLTPPEAQ